MIHSRQASLLRALCFLSAAISIFGASSLAATLCVNPGGKSGCKATISAAVAAAHPGDTIRVASGSYADSVTITQPLSLIGDVFHPPVIDATGKPNGIFINGMAAAPNAGIAGVQISGFKVENANFEGILVANASNVSLAGNHVTHNDKALLSGGGCPGIPAFETNEADDCGEGIHLMAVDHSIVLDNLVEDNSGGILTSDETGPTSDNIYKGNVVRDNPWDCGITFASHPPATSVVATARGPFGIARNTITGNQSYRNGLGAPGAGAGVGIFAPFPGTTDTANVVIDNDIYDNGLPGVTMHNHAWAPSPAPGVNLNDNKIIGNRIHGNAADTDDAFTPGPTGINIYSVAPITGTVITQNKFSDESINVAFNAPTGQLDVHFNDFDERGIGIDNLGAAWIDATQNWWNCPAGPSTKCSSTTGANILTTPWLPYPSVLPNN